MCGFTGYLGFGHWCQNERATSILTLMANAIYSRGPDDAGVWHDEGAGFGIAHRRLSIVDLSPSGHQPMRSPSNRYVIAFNGEIYNHQDLRAELEKQGAQVAWRGHSDTESLLAGFDTWGIQKTIERAIGMFAIAVWDRESHTLTLIRDRLGEKPLYFGWMGDAFLFGSELKSMKPHPAWRGEIDRGALSLYMRHNYIPTPYSSYQGISKLKPGCLATVSLKDREPKISQYWSGASVATFGAAKPLAANPVDAINELDALLKDAVRRQMMADVPLGAFLSGGIDSSTVVALMQSQSSSPIKTFTIGFNEPGYNEAEHAKAVAQHLGTDHTELYVTAEEAQAVIPLLPELYDEPFSDSSQIPTHLVSRLARQKVTVSLSGDAGDELFCGYNRYQMTAKLWGKLSSIPKPLRQLAAKGMISIPPHRWNGIAKGLAHVLPSAAKYVTVGDKLHKGAGVLASQTVDKLYLDLVSHWNDPGSVVIGGSEPPTQLTGNAPTLKGLDDIQRMMALDMLTYLPDDILTKVDRAAMGVSLETRVPFLDHRVVEFAWRLPQSLKLRDGKSKWALQQVLFRHVPKELLERPKMGFGIPIDSWLRGPLRAWAEELLSESRLKREGFFHPGPIRQKWKEHLDGHRNWQYLLWDVLMFQLWLDKNPT
jgi:asparagine synthase (glutamine-hydrolysing)